MSEIQRDIDLGRVHDIGEKWIGMGRETHMPARARACLLDACAHLILPIDALRRNGERIAYAVHLVRSGSGWCIGHGHGHG